MDTISKVEKSWLAGIVDGEGSINATLVSKHYNSLYFSCCVYNTNPLIVAEVVRIMSGILGRRPTVYITKRTEIRRPCFHITAGNRKNVTVLLTTILPYLRGKCHEAELVLKMADLMTSRPRGNKWTGRIPIPMHVELLLAEFRKRRDEVHVSVGNPEPSCAGAIGSAEGATVRGVSANDNPLQERAPSSEVGMMR